MLGSESQEEQDVAPQIAAHGRRQRRRAALAGALGATVLAGLLAAVMGSRGPETRIETGSPSGPTRPDSDLGQAPVSPDSTIVKAGTPATEAPAEIVALSSTEVVVLDSKTGRRLRVIAVHPEAESDTGVFLEGLATSPDHRSAYYALAGDCGTGTVYRVSVDGRSPPEPVASGISPAISPDGAKLAYATPGGPGPAGRPQCNNRIVVRDLATGAERTWRYPDAEVEGNVLYQDGAITKIAWAPDSTRLAYALSYEGDSVAVLDTAVHGDLSQTLEVVVPGGGGDSRHPSWQASSGRLAIVNSAFECCYADSYTGPPRTLLIDPELKLSQNLLVPGKKPSWLDFDLTGDHLLYVDGGTLYRRTGDGSPVVVGRDLIAADW